jgi:hypothetical protein
VSGWPGDRRRLESSVERLACTRAKRAGWKVVKDGQKGRPDRIFTRAGVRVWIEFKRPGECPRPLQEVQHTRLRAQGELVYVCTSVEEAEAALQDACLQRAYAAGLARQGAVL